MESEKIIVMCCPDCVCQHDAPICKKTRDKIKKAVENGVLVIDDKQMCDICKEEKVDG